MDARAATALQAYPSGARFFDGRARAGHVDRRPFVLSARDDVSVIPGGLTRVAFGPGALVVNSSQNGGGKDTWVLE